MSVMEMRAVAVLDKPKFKFPSISVAWTMMVYWETFCKRKRWKKFVNSEKSLLFLLFRGNTLLSEAILRHSLQIYML